jgi:pyrroloquinoline quinone biosynthesis protein D
MTERVIVSLESVPRLASHMRLRHDRVRDSWTVQAPERSFILDPIAHAIVLRCDGASNVGQVIDLLCGQYPDAPRDIIQGDVLKLIQDFADKGVMET